MFKVYKWLGYYLLRPYKRFEHLLKYLAIYFAKLNKLQKNRKERLNRIKKKTYLSPRRSRPTPAQPAQRGTGVFFPVPRLQAARWNATALAGHATSSPRSFQPSPWPLLAPGRAWRRRELFLPLQSFLLLLPWSFPSPPEDSPEHRSAPAWPLTLRSPKNVSKLFIVVVFVELQKESSPEP